MPSKEEKKIVRELRAIAEQRGGKVHQDTAVKRLSDKHGYSIEKARQMLENSSIVQFNERGFTFADPSIVESKGFSGDLSDIEQIPGPISGRKFRGLQILEPLEDGHPLIPPERDYFVRKVSSTSATDVEVLCQAMADGDFSPLLIGEAGTGKDTLIKHVCAKTNRPMVRVNFGSDVRYENLIGMYVLDEDGEMEWVDGALTRAVRYGWVFVADEINAAPPEATMPLHQVTEEEGEAKLTLRDKAEVIDPHPQFRFVATMNPPEGYGGAKELNDAFKSRFYSIVVDYLDEDREKELLERQLDDNSSLDEDDLEKLTSLAARLREQHKQRDILTPITTRELLKICKLAESMSIKDAAKIVLEGHAKENDERIIQEVVSTFF